MITPEQYELCEQILKNKNLEYEERVEQIEGVLRNGTMLTGKALEDAVLGALWKHRHAERGEDEAPHRQTVIRRSSPAPWQAHRAPTPTGSPKPSSSPALTSAFPVSRPSFSRARSAASPFASPKPSPRMAIAQPIPHSPSLNRYEFSSASPAPPDSYDDFDSDYIDSLIEDETGSNASFNSTGTLNAAATEWVPQSSMSMSTFDMLRNVLGDQMSDDQIESALEENSYDLVSTMAALYSSNDPKPKDTIDNIDGNILVGKSMAAQPRPGTPGSTKSPVVCKYWLASGSCLRADCRFAHDTTGYLCKYWMQGHCLAGDNCQFSHDPSVLLSNLNVTEQSNPKNMSLQDSVEQFPSLGPTIPSGPRSNVPQFKLPMTSNLPSPYHVSNQSGLGAPASRPYRPSSRHSSRPTTPSSLSMDDPDAFPTLGSLPGKRGSKHHGNRSRRGGAASADDNNTAASSLADIVKMSSPSPSPAQMSLRRAAHTNTERTRNPGGRGTDFGKTIPEPKHIPWLETGNKANEQYLRYRAEAIKHGSIRNKFLQRYVLRILDLLLKLTTIAPLKHGIATMPVLRRHSPFVVKPRTRRCEKHIVLPPKLSILNAMHICPTAVMKRCISTYTAYIRKKPSNISRTLCMSIGCLLV